MIWNLLAGMVIGLCIGATIRFRRRLRTVRVPAWPRRVTVRTRRRDVPGWKIEIAPVEFAKIRDLLLTDGEFAAARNRQEAT